MYTLSRVLWLSCLVLLGTLPAVADDDVVGIWSSLTRTKGGLGSQWIFTKDGKVTYTFGALVDFKYKIEGNQMKMTLLAPDRSVTKEVPTKEFSIHDDTLIESPNAPDRKQIMKRTGKPYKNTTPIVGEWTYEHYTGGPAIMRYSDTGFVQLSVPLKTLTGTYRTSRGAISVTLRDQKPVSYKLKRAEDVLVLTDGEGAEKRFLKFEF